MLKISLILTLFVGFLYPQQVWKNTDTTTTILLTFSEPIQKNLSISDFTLIDSLTRHNYRLYGFGYPQSQENAVVLISERIPYKKTVVISVTNVTDTAGNVIDPQKNKIFLYHSGLNPNLQKPIVR